MVNESESMTEILRLPDVKQRVGLSRSTIYLRISSGSFPKPVSLGGRAVGWPAREVAMLNAARISGKTDSEICELVEEMETARKSDAMRSNIILPKLRYATEESK